MSAVQPGALRRIVVGLPLGWLLLCVAAPIVMVFGLAFGELADRIPPIQPLLEFAHGRVVPHLTLSALAATASDPLYAAAFGNAFLNALETTLLCVLIGYPIAYAIALAPEKHRRLYVLLAVLCLLYTSPSPRDYAASRMPSSA